MFDVSTGAKSWRTQKLPLPNAENVPELASELVTAKPEVVQPVRFPVSKPGLTRMFTASAELGKARRHARPRATVEILITNSNATEYKLQQRVVSTLTGASNPRTYTSQGC